MSSRLYVNAPLAAGAEFALPPETSRHAQVLRLQPGSPLRLFNGSGGQWLAEVVSMGRQSVAVRVLVHEPRDTELARMVTLALGMPANDRMDTLVEKATELGMAALQPLHTSRSVLRLEGERAAKRQAHWQGVAVAASEQSGRTRVPELLPVRSLSEWLSSLPAAADGEQRWLLSFAADALPPSRRPSPRPDSPLTLLSGPEGGLDPHEETQARQHGFLPVSLGSRVLRADTAPLAVLAWLGLQQA